MNEPASFHPLTKESIRRNNLIFEWDTPEYHHYQRTNDWYWIVSLIAGAAAIIAMLFGDTLFAVIIAIATFIMIVYAKRPPDIITVSVNTKGIRIKNNFYPFVNINSFCVKEHFHGHVLLLDIDKMFAPIVTVMVDETEVDLHSLHQYLEAFIPEVDQPVPLVEIISDYLGF